MRQLVLRNDSRWPHSFYCHTKTPHKPRWGRSRRAETCDCNIISKPFQVPLKGRGKKKKPNKWTKKNNKKNNQFCKVQNIRRIKVQVILKLSRFAMDVLHDTFHMTDFRRELRFFFFPPSPHRRGAGNNKGKRETVIKTWNAETCTVSWWEEPVSVYSFEHVWLSNCGFCTWWEEQV